VKYLKQTKRRDEMKKKGNGEYIPRIILLFLLFFFQILSCSQVHAQNTMWVSAYYAGWMQSCGSPGHLSANQIDYSAVTHIIHFAIVPNSDGSLNSWENCISPENSEELIQAAHAAGKKVLISVGGWMTESEFLGATNDRNRARFIANLVSFMNTRGYDGLDIDWEPVSSSSANQIITFITQLRSELDLISPRPLLTTAVLWQPDLFSLLKEKFDQMNVMTYVLSGPWPGWITWHNAPIYDGGYWFPSTGEPVPSADGLVNDFLSAGVPPEKLGIGIHFYGAVWSGGSGTPTGGVTAPGQSWISAPSMEMLSYYEIMDTYYQPQNYRWDSAALASYLSIDNIGSSNDKFISYDDETTCYEKIKYVRNKGMGGLIIFELGGGWRPGAPVPDNLLQAVKSEAWGSPNSVPQPPVLNYPSNGAAGIPANTTLRWNASTGAESYTLQVSTSLTFSTFILNQSSIVSASYALNGLSVNTTYYWHVNAKNVSGTSEWSSVGSFTTAPSVTVIVNFAGKPVSSGVLLSWQTISEYNNKGFDIERRDAASPIWAKTGFVSGAGTFSSTKNYSFVDKRVRKGKKYVYRLKQINTDGKNTYSQEVTVQK
jgi:chitinase